MNSQRLVQVWFGQHVLCDYSAEPAEAHHYAEAMQRRFMGLRVTVTESDGLEHTPLPDNSALWSLTVK